MKTLRDRVTETLAMERNTRGGRKRRRTGKASEKSLTGMIFDNSAALTFMGLTLGIFVSKKFFLVPFAVGLTMAQEFAKDRFLEPTVREFR